MIVRILICLILIILGHKLVVAQDRPTGTPEPAQSARKASHYIGIQANQLLRQLVSFGGSSAVNNPYLLSYSANSKSNGFGFATGLGFSSVTTRSTDNFTSVVSKVNDFALRLGLEEKRYLSKYWLAGFGGDVVIDANSAETISHSDNTPDISVTSRTKRAGFGPRASLTFQFHDRLMVGTEAAYYFKWGNQEQVSNNSGQPNDNTKVKSFAFSLPSAIFLTMKL